MHDGVPPLPGSRTDQGARLPFDDGERVFRAGRRCGSGDGPDHDLPDLLARARLTLDITAARRGHILAHLRAAGLGGLVDLGFIGLDDDGDDPVVVTGLKAARARKLAPAEREANRILAAIRAPVERGFAHI
ncbi:hypothetical protein [Streptomyces sp. NPDC003710]